LTPPFEFHRDFVISKLVSLCYVRRCVRHPTSLAILVQYRLVTERQTDKRPTTAYTTA